MSSSDKTPITITSPTHLDSLLAKHDYLLLDFWATWCPPCKAIAPLFTTLSTQSSVPGKFAFAKIDVDAQRELAQRYRVSAMPTFLLVGRDGEAVKGVRGADAGAIRRVVGWAGKKARGEVTTGEEDEMDDVKGMGDGGGGSPLPMVLLLAVLAYFIFWRK